VVKVSVVKVLLKAKSHEKKGEILQAQKLYQAALQSFPKNKNLQQRLATLIKNNQSTSNQSPSQENINQLITIYEKGKFSDAVEQATIFTKKYPGTIVGWTILGISQNRLGKVFEASQTFKSLTKLHPNYADGFNNFGVTTQAQGRLEEALEAYHKALSLKPDYADAHYNMGNVLKEQGKLNEAVKAYNKALSLKPNAKIYNNKGIALREQCKLEKAIEAYNSALSLNPNYAEAFNNLGNVLKDQGKLNEAIKAYNKALSLNPNYAEAYNNSGNALREQGKLNEAIETYNKVLSLNPNYAEAYNNIGLVLQDQGKLNEAIEAYNKALSLNPNYAEAYNNMGLVLQDQGKLNEAIEAYNEALLLKPNFPDAVWNQSFALLSNGNFYTGWAQYEKRWERSNYIYTPLHSAKPKWEPNQGGRVLVWSEQGLGDLIMFSSIIPELCEQSEKLIIQTDERLIPLFKRSFSSDIIYYGVEEKISEQQYDYHIPIGSLPLHFRTNLKSFEKNSGAYLKADNLKADNLRSELLSDGSDNLIGISWHTTNRLKGAQNRNITLEQLTPILQLPKTKLISLQYGDVKKDIDSLFNNFNIKVYQVPEINNMKDIDDLAALITACDSIISIDNSTIHLAGALGKESKLLLPYSCDWRWPQGVSTSQWYSSVKLYRQTEIGNWDHVLRKL